MLKKILNRVKGFGNNKITVCQLDGDTQQLLVGLNERSIFTKNEVLGVSAGVQEIILLLKSIQQSMQSKVTGGMIIRIGATMNPIQPGNTVKFLVAPTFSGVPFALVGANASVVSSDPANFPVNIDLTDDPTGATFESVIPTGATPTGGSEAITVTWSYKNTDGTVATVSGTVTELGIVDDVTGGTFTQIS